MAGADEVISQLNNIAVQLSGWYQSLSNAYPIPTTTASPKFTAVLLSTTASVVISTSTLRHGIMMHNPGTANVYLYATAIQTSPTTSNLAGSILISPGATLTLPSSGFPNINAGFSAFSGTGSSQAFTVIEFF